MIKFHYHRAGRDIPRLCVQKGDTLVHAYSDESREELIAWGNRYGLKPEWIDDRNALPHFDLFGESVALAEGRVSRTVLVADLARWRTWEKAGGERGGHGGPGCG
jgi:hypothetical protein